MFKRKKQELEITVSNKTLLRILAFGIATYAGFRFFNNISHALTLIFVSFFLALALNPAVSFVTRKLKSKSRIRGTAVAYAVVITVLVSFFSLIVPPLVKQSTTFVREVPDKIKSLENQDSALGKLVRRYDLSEQLNSFANEWAVNISDTSGPVFTTANKIVGGVVSVITVVVLTFMMLIEGPLWVRKFLSQLPSARRAHAESLMKRMYDVVTSFVNAQVLIALIASFFSLIALTVASRIYDASINPVALAGLVLLFGIIPTIGNILAAVVVSFACLFASTPLAITMLIYFIVYQQIENITIQPYIQSRSNDLSPLLVFVAALLGIGFGGLLGGFVAIPIAGCVKILLEDWLDDRLINASDVTVS